MLFSAKTRGLMILLFSSLGEEVELGPVSPGLVGGVGIDPPRAWEMSYAGSQTCPEMVGSALYLCLVDW